MKTAVIYARYSSNNQTEQSIEGQVHVCQDFAQKNDIIIVDSYIDRAISGTTDNRDSFQQMLKDSNNKKWDYVLVYKLDRFARNKFESAIHRKHLKDNGVKLLSVMENIPETPEGILLESLLEGMNLYNVLSFLIRVVHDLLFVLILHYNIGSFLLVRILTIFLQVFQEYFPLLIII